MAVTNEKTDVFTNLSATPPLLNARPGMPFKVDFRHVQGAAAGDANSTIEVYRVQPGMTLDLYYSWIKFTSGTGAGRLMSFGYRAYTEADGTVVAAALTALFSALDIAAALTLKNMIEAPTIGAGITAGNRLFRGPADLVFQVTGNTIPIGAVTEGRLWLYSGG